MTVIILKLFEQFFNREMSYSDLQISIYKSQFTNLSSPYHVQQFISTVFYLYLHEIEKTSTQNILAAGVTHTYEQKCFSFKWGHLCNFFINWHIQTIKSWKNNKKICTNSKDYAQFCVVLEQLRLRSGLPNLSSAITLFFECAVVDPCSVHYEL